MAKVYATTGAQLGNLDSLVYWSSPCPELHAVFFIDVFYRVFPKLK
jgi:hypothetical protein